MASASLLIRAVVREVMAAAAKAAPVPGRKARPACSGLRPPTPWFARIRSRLALVRVEEALASESEDSVPYLAAE
jgi:hypothetical protein